MDTKPNDVINPEGVEYIPLRIKKQFLYFTLLIKVQNNEVSDTTGDATYTKARPRKIF